MHIVLFCEIELGWIIFQIQDSHISTSTTEKLYNHLGIKYEHGQI